MKTLGELMNIDATRQGKAGSCSVELVKIFHELKPESIPDKIKSSFGGRSIVQIYYVVFKFSVTSDTGKKHTVYIKTTPDFDLVNWENNRAFVYCDCEDFKYRSAYTLNSNNALFENDKTKLSLGPALTTPPKRTPSLLCKHAYAALNWFVSNYSNLMKTI
jgi:hypothetical protein